MPIRPERRGLYPSDWPAISARIRERAGNRCEWCGARNGAVGYRDEGGVFHELSPTEADATVAEGGQTVRIVLTVAHLDHAPSNCDDNNLAALCQQCHLRYDRHEHARHAAETRRRKLEEAGQRRLL